MNKRSRVLGSGPRRHQLPNFYEVFQIQEDDMLEIRREAMIHLVDNDNDLFSKGYRISSECALTDMIPQNHVNVLLQKPPRSSDGLNEKEYVHWIDCRGGRFIQKFLTNHFMNSYRARIAVLAPHEGIDWHIDMNTSVSCRFHIPVINPGFIFEIKRKGQVEKLDLKESRIYFTNVAYPHRVFNPTDLCRISLIFELEYNNLKYPLPLL